MKRQGRGNEVAPRSVKPDSQILAAIATPVQRRTLLKYAGALSAVGLVELRSQKSILAALSSLLQSPVLTATATRPDDLLSLRFDFINFRLEAGTPQTPAKLVPLERGNAFVVVHFEPQHIAEEAFFEGSTPASSDPLPTPPIGARLAGKSRLAFNVPATVDSLPFSLDALMDWDSWTPNLAPVVRDNEGQTVATPKIREPEPDETAIEAPWRLTISPDDKSHWQHATQPVVHGGRSELWHTRMTRDSVRQPVGGTIKKDEGKAGIVRAIWTPEFNRKNRPSDPEPPDPFLMSLDDGDRWAMVKLTSDYFEAGLKNEPVQVDQLMLSTLGAWMDMRANWSYPNSAPVSVIHWSHRATMGRDHFVKVISKGYLYPFGHAAVLIKITERKFQAIQSGAQKGKIGAFLRQRKFIVVKQPEVANSDRQLPYRAVRITTLKTPDLNNPPQDPKSGILPGDEGFWPRVGADDFQFHLIGTDWENKTTEFTAPLIFLETTTDNEVLLLLKVMTDYLKGPEGRRRRDLGGQKVAFAPSTTGKPGDTTLETQNLEFGGIFRTGEPHFRPLLISADVRLQAVEQIKSGDLKKPRILYHQGYVKDGFAGANADAQIFVKLKDPVALDYGGGGNGDRSGGLVAPNMSISGLSRKTGPVGGDLSKPALPEKFDPLEFFKDAKILGGIDLVDILDVVGFGKAPAILNRTIYPNGDTSAVPQSIETSMSWALKKVDLKPDQPAQLFEPGATASLTIKALFATPIDPPGEPTFEIAGELTDFTIHMIGKPSAFLILHFNKVKFTAKKGKKPDVDVDLDDVKFAGILSFVNELKDFMNTGGSGLNIDVTPKHIEAGYTLELPTLSVGIFSIQNMSLSAGVLIPFTGDPVQASFAFCKRDAPFLLSYAIFGGGGFFQITVGQTKHGLGMQLLEASLEFGATAALDIGVASGSVHIMAGIYFAIGIDPDSDCGEEIAELSGYIRMGGELDILGLISLSLEFKMSLTYDFAKDEVFGQATLVVEVEVLMFSASVELSVEKRFGGGNGAPANCAPGRRPLGQLSQAQQPAPTKPVSFDELVSKPNWQSDYAPAFAAAAFV